MNSIITIIGTVRSKFSQSADPFEMRKHESTIIINEQFRDGLFKIEENRYLQVVFLFDRSEDYTLKGPRYHGDVKGVFACRSPRRPSNIGITTVELVKRTDLELRVKGLDALDGTPVIDIKPHVPPLDHLQDADEEDTFLTRGPGTLLTPLIKNRDMKQLLLKAGQFHGHFCPGIALGVLAATEGLHRFAEYRTCSVASLLTSEGMEEILAVVETNSCFADGIQVVSGCTLGNNSLIYRDFGKTAVTFADRTGDGLRISVHPEYRNRIDRDVPHFSQLFEAVVKNRSRDESLLHEYKTAAREASLFTVELQPADILSVAEIHVSIPPYAPIRETVACSRCGESVMGGKTVTVDGSEVCLACAGTPGSTLTGAGIFCDAHDGGNGVPRE